MTPAKPKKPFTPQPNEIVDFHVKHMRTHIEKLVYWFLTRHTWGWNRETAEASYSEIADTMGISHKSAYRAIKGLEKQGYVTVIRDSRRSFTRHETPQPNKYTIQLPTGPTLIPHIPRPETGKETVKTPIKTGGMPGHRVQACLDSKSRVPGHKVQHNSKTLVKKEETPTPNPAPTLNDAPRSARSHSGKTKPSDKTEKAIGSPNAVALDIAVNRKIFADPASIQTIQAAALKANPSLTDEEMALAVDLTTTPTKGIKSPGFFTIVLPKTIRSSGYRAALEKFRSIREEDERRASEPPGTGEAPDTTPEPPAPRSAPLCPRCKGTGKEPNRTGHAPPCYKCNGTGTQEATV